MYEKILVPLDGSELAEVPLFNAERLAGRMGSKITLLYVNDPQSITSPHMYESYLKEVAARVKKAADKYTSEETKGKVKVDYAILDGDPAEEIVDYADSANIDLIVMSTQGKSGVRRWALGNVAHKVLQATNKRVYLIRAKGAETDVGTKRTGKALVPVDGSKESESILKYVIPLAEKLGLELTLFHIWDRQSQWSPGAAYLKVIERTRKARTNYIEKLAAKVSEKGVKAKAVFHEVWGAGSSEAEEIIKLAKEGGYSLVAMATSGRSGIRRWVFGSTAHKVLNEGSTPLLLVRPSKRKK